MVNKIMNLTEKDPMYNELVNEEYPESDVTWLNRLLDCGDTTEIYVPDTSISITCEIIEER